MRKWSRIQQDLLGWHPVLQRIPSPARAWTSSMGAPRCRQVPRSRGCVARVGACRELARRRASSHGALPAPRRCPVISPAAARL